jgi:YVTN family beta-propeller protein
MKVRVWKLLSALMIAVFALVPVRTVLATGTLQPSYIIKGAGGGYVVYDSSMGEIFTQTDGGVNVISDNNSLVTTINVGIPSGDAHELVYDSGTGEIFESWGGTSDYAAATISVISDSNNTVIGTVAYNAYQYSLTFPLGMAYDSGKGEIFICDSGYHPRTGYTYGGGVYVVNDSTNAIITSIGVAGPHEAAYDSGKGEIFVATGSNTVSVISDVNNAVVANITVGSYPYGMAYDSNKGRSVCVQRGRRHRFGHFRQHKHGGGNGHGDSSRNRRTNLDSVRSGQGRDIR